VRPETARCLAASSSCAPAAGDEPADLLERPLRRRQADALDRLGDEAVEALDREREVRPALRPGDGVDLVQDHEGARVLDQSLMDGCLDGDLRVGDGDPVIVPGR